MEIFWLIIVALMITVYVLLDGFDLGAGAIHLLVAKTEEERRSVIASIGPVWDGNEVWLIAGGGVLYFAFPTLYASSFSGFYLPLMIVLWLLILRGVSIELRNHIDTPIWKPFWDAVFFGASTLLAAFFGAALGNVIRGVPLEPSGFFFLPLWTDFGFGEAGLHSAQGGILDWFTIQVGLLALLTLAVHGARWVILKTEGEIQHRCKALVSTLWWGVLLMVILVTISTWLIQPQVLENFNRAPWGAVFPVLALLGLAGLKWFHEQERLGFLSSGLFIVGMLTSAAFGIFPYVLPSSTDPSLGLTIYQAATEPYGLWVGIWWWIPGILLTTGYFVYTYRQFSGKVQLNQEGH